MEMSCFFGHCRLLIVQRNIHQYARDKRRGWLTWGAFLMRIPFRETMTAKSVSAIRILKTGDMPLLVDHLLRLDPESRHDRFNGAVDSDFIVRYAEGCADKGVTVIGYFENGAVRAAAEIHEPTRSSDLMPEIAFSVERDLRRQGIGSRLFAFMLAEAKKAGYERLRVTTGAQNCAMRALAQKFGARLVFGHGELSGSIDLAEVEFPKTAIALQGDKPGSSLDPARMTPARSA
jgi:GNAT superfamily N-acetyltransferase